MLTISPRTLILDWIFSGRLCGQTSVHTRLCGPRCAHRGFVQTIYNKRLCGQTSAHARLWGPRFTRRGFVQTIYNERLRGRVCAVTQGFAGRRGRSHTLCGPSCARRGFVQTTHSVGLCWRALLLRKALVADVRAQGSIGPGAHGGLVADLIGC